MTETEWLESSSPENLLTYLGERASRRKRRLFACACVRRIWPLLCDDRLRLAVKAVERCADQGVSAQVLERARRIARELREKRQEAEWQQASWTALSARAAAQAVEALLEEEPIVMRPRDIRDQPDVISSTRTARAAARAAEAQREEDATALREPMRRLHTFDAVELVREIFGNPFRPVTLDPAWLQWRNGLIPRTARLIYGKRCFRNLPILADALEEAGCQDAEILNHCRAPVEHVRGCWVVDFLLGMA